MKHRREGSLTTRVSRKVDKKNFPHKEASEHVPSSVTGERVSRVACTLGYTMGLPNYSSIQVHVTCEIPCDVGHEKLTFERAKNFCKVRLKKELRSIEEDLKE